MNKRFNVGGAITAASPVVYRFHNATENAQYYNLDGNAPTLDMWLAGLTVTAYGAFKFEFGLADTDGGNFTPYYTTYATLATSGGLVKTWPINEPLIPYSSTRVPACRITVYADATVYAAGDYDLRSR